MHLLNNWRAVALRAWSLRFLYGLVILIVLDEVIPYLEPWIPLADNFWLAIAFGLAKSALLIAALIARVLFQENLKGD